MNDNKEMSESSVECRYAHPRVKINEIEMEK